MTEVTMKKSVAKEARRLKELLTDAGVVQIDGLISVIENVAWMKVQLVAAREEIKAASIVVEYDNGGGQKGTRENPLFKAYEALWKSYMIGMTKILDYLPKAVAKEEVPEEDTPKSVLALVRARHGAEA